MPNQGTSTAHYGTNQVVLTQQRLESTAPANVMSKGVPNGTATTSNANLLSS